MLGRLALLLLLRLLPPAAAAPPRAASVGAVASLPTDAGDGHTPTFAFAAAPTVDLRAAYSYDEFVARFGATLQRLEVEDLAGTFTRRLDADGDGALRGAETAALATLLEEEERRAQRAAEDAPLGLEQFEERYDRWLAADEFRVFERLDADGDGRIDAAELERVGEFLDSGKLRVYANLKQDV